MGELHHCVEFVLCTYTATVTGNDLPSIGRFHLRTCSLLVFAPFFTVPHDKRSAFFVKSHGLLVDRSLFCILTGSYLSVVAPSIDTSPFGYGK